MYTSPLYTQCCSVVTDSPMPTSCYALQSVFHPVDLVHCCSAAHPPPLSHPNLVWKKLPSISRQSQVSHHAAEHPRYCAVWLRVGFGQPTAYHWLGSVNHLLVSLFLLHLMPVHPLEQIYHPFVWVACTPSPLPAHVATFYKIEDQGESEERHSSSDKITIHQ